MKSVSYGLLIVLLFTGQAQAQDTPKSKPKSNFNTQVYEKTEEPAEEASFEAMVKLIREVQGDTEVFFEGQKGFFTISSSKGHNLLVDSKKKKFPVKVVVNPSTRQILQVEISMSKSGDSEE